MTTDDSADLSNVEGPSGQVEPRKDAIEQSRLLFKLGLSFFLFGLINNVLYVIILSAALDLVPPSTPKGIIAFCNIAPAFVAKVGWPYFLKGRIRYVKRLVGCCLLSVLGMIVVAGFESLYMRLLGIGIASFSSGLGELTFLQLSTVYHPPSVGGHSVGYFASGTGAAGLVGAFLWWELRNLGVKTGVGISAMLPFVIPVTFFCVLPKPDMFSSFSMALHPDIIVSSPSEYTALPSNDPSSNTEQEDDEEETPESQASQLPPSKLHVSLSPADKWRLVRPLMLKYMLPLFCVYTFEYTINQGIAPTLVYPVPNSSEHPILSSIIKSVRDYYPLWQLVYQATVFLSRSSISFGLPPLPARLLSLPAIVQAVILLFLATESGLGIFPDNAEGLAIGVVFLMISFEGVCGGLAYVNVFYRLNQDRVSSHTDDPSRSLHEQQQLERQIREFRIGSIGFADSSGILLASILAVPTEVALCRAQIRRGKTLCGSL
ncbi:batten's disease protein Cln3 [Schizopora paradoxa]|uniref:Protein BTN n=1 Tax=Schizopora paradoxa TaxID=27342 RepID=A0A0H2R417_9AGAM|nr:batten's disease protein Cln3 [Schizopora paradoxa]